jgi:hypothetical protein
MTTQRNITAADGLALAIKRAGGTQAGLAAGLSKSATAPGLVSAAAVSRWVKLGRVPIKRALQIEIVFEVPRKFLRPDYW